MEDFEEQALSSAPCVPKIWKRYIDDTFTVLNRNNIDTFLQHLTSRQLTIRFTTETENNNAIPFLDTLVTRESEGHLTTSDYTKPTHTDQYLLFTHSLNQ